MVIVALERLVVSYLNHVGLHPGCATYQLGNLRQLLNLLNHYADEKNIYHSCMYF